MGKYDLLILHKTLKLINFIATLGRT